MPRDHRRGLENFQRVEHAGRQAIETSEHEPIDVAEGKALRGLAPQHIELMTKDENFGLQPSARPERPGHKAPNQPAEIDHRTEYHPIRRQRPDAFGFTVGTGVLPCGSTWPGAVALSKALSRLRNPACPHAGLRRPFQHSIHAYFRRRQLPATRTPKRVDT